MVEKIKAVLFDLDGTLLDTVDGLAAAGNRMLAAKGFPVHPVDAYRHFVGEGAAKLIHRALPEYVRTTKIEKECLKFFLDDYGDNWRDGSRPYKGIIPLLHGLIEQGLRLAVLSNKPHEITVQCITHFFDGWPFEIVLGQRPGVPKKPDPAGALEVMERMNLPARAFLYLGDTAIDMQTARAVGMHPVGVCWGFRPIEELQNGGAQHLIEHPLDTLAYIIPPPGND